jgi:hypothetical protein
MILNNDAIRLPLDCDSNQIDFEVDNTDLIFVIHIIREGL